MVQTPKGGHIAEIGFGSGMTSILLANLGYKVTALDIDPDVIDLLKDKIGYINNLYVQKQDMFNLKNFDNNYFDIVYHQGVLEHFTDNEIIQTLRQQGRIAKKVVFDVPNDKRKIKFQLYGNERFLSINHWKELIGKSDLHVEKICGRRFPKYYEWLPSKLKNPNSWFARLKGESNTYVCKKFS
jgi:ubiquinone/menaquinone biosynthesis C-methylase UbiE